MPRLRFTIRRLMRAVAAIALILTCLRWLAEALSDSPPEKFPSAVIGLLLVVSSFVVLIIVKFESRQTHPRPASEAIQRTTHHALAVILVIAVAIGSTMLGSGLRSHWDRYRPSVVHHQTRKGVCITYVKQLEVGRQRDIQLLRDSQQSGDHRGAGLLRTRIDLREKAIGRFRQTIEEEGQAVDRYRGKLYNPWRVILAR